MTTKTTSPKYDGQTPKEIEIDALIAFRAQFSDGTYMATFLDEKTIAYFAQMARNDFPPALRENLEYAIETSDKERAAAQKIAAEKTARVEILDRELTNAKRTIETTVAECGRLSDEIAKYRGELRTTREQLNDAEYTAEQTIAARDAEIMKLKSMIFDLEHAAK